MARNRKKQRNEPSFSNRTEDAALSKSNSEEYFKSLKAHGLYGNNGDLELSSDSSDDSSEVREFDEKYYSLQPPPVDIDTNNVVIIDKKCLSGTPIQSKTFHNKSSRSVPNSKKKQKAANQGSLLRDNSSSLSIKNHPSNTPLRSIQRRRPRNRRRKDSSKQPSEFQNTFVQSPVSSQSISVHNEIASKQRPKWLSNQSSEFQSPSTQSQNIPNQRSEITSEQPSLSQYSIFSQPLSVHNQNIPNQRSEITSKQSILYQHFIPSQPLSVLSVHNTGIPYQRSEITSERPSLSQYSISSQPLSVHNQNISNWRPEPISGQPWQIRSPSVQNQRGSDRGLTNINSNCSTPIQTVPNRRLETSSGVSDPVFTTNSNNFDGNSSRGLLEGSEDDDCCSFCCRIC